MQRKAIIYQITSTKLDENFQTLTLKFIIITNNTLPSYDLKKTLFLIFELTFLK